MRSGTEINDEVEDFVTCALACHDNPKTLLIIGSTVHGEMTEYSDIDGVMLVNSNDRNTISDCKEKFSEIAVQQYEKNVENSFYEPDWGLFIYPEEALVDKNILSRYCPLPTDFTLFNLKHNSMLVSGVDARRDITVKYNEDLIDEWLTFAPRYHLMQSERLVRIENDAKKGTYALSRAILQISRGVAWKEDKNTSSSYESIVQSMKKLEHHSTNLAEWALEKRRRDFESTIRETENKLKPAENFLDNTLEKYGNREREDDIHTPHERNVETHL